MQIQHLRIKQELIFKSSMRKYVIKVWYIIIDKQWLPIEIRHAKIIDMKHRIKGKQICKIKARYSRRCGGQLDFLTPAAPLWAHRQIHRFLWFMTKYTSSKWFYIFVYRFSPAPLGATKIKIVIKDGILFRPLTLNPTI